MKEDNNFGETNFTQQTHLDLQEINGQEIPIRKQAKIDSIVQQTNNESVPSLASDFNCRQRKSGEQRKQVLKEIRHLASIGSQMQINPTNYKFGYSPAGIASARVHSIMLYISLFFALIYYSTGYLELPTAQIKDYKNQSKEEVLIDDVLLDKFLPPNSITPIIFTRKLPQGGQYRQKANQPTWVGAFENLLTVVVQLYYKSDQKIAEFMKDKIPMDSRKELKPDKRPGRKKKAIQNQEAENMNSEFLEPQQNGVTTIYGQLQQDVLEILISPLRSDFPFEQWTLKEIAIFECAICRYGKQYEFLAQILRNKTAQDILQFYYFWKFTSHYKLWKLNKAYYHRSNLNNFV